MEVSRGGVDEGSGLSPGGDEEGLAAAMAVLVVVVLVGQSAGARLL
jgi:hypothetical protein